MATPTRSALLLAALALVPFAAAADDAARGPFFENARRRAVEKLETQECRRVLDDFEGESTRSLAGSLAATRLTAAEFFARLEFRDGRWDDTCQRSRVEAFTRVSGSRVWVCPRWSLGPGGADAGTGANALIHEMLHALGLGEDPPTSLEINRRVRARCGP
jgi:hypothetical protein